MSGCSRFRRDAAGTEVNHLDDAAAAGASARQLVWALSPGPAGTAALVAPSLLYVAASGGLHRYLHRSPRHAAATEAALGEAAPRNDEFAG
jgi:hypothetical protein